MILLTVPIVFPAMMQLGFDPVWFGVIVVMAVTFGMICPPVGMNVFVINSIARDISLVGIYRGTMPFIAVDLVRLVILCAFPVLALWLPVLSTESGGQGRPRGGMQANRSRARLRRRTTLRRRQPTRRCPCSFVPWLPLPRCWPPAPRLHSTAPPT